MTWTRFSHGHRLDPVGKRSPEALVILLHDLGASSLALTPIAARWATTVPTTMFIALDAVEPLDPPSSGLLPHPVLGPDGSAEPTMLNRATRLLEPLIEQQLRSCRFDASRLVLVGFGYGGTLALHMVLRRGRNCAGVLAFAANPTRPLPQVPRVARKVRLIESVKNGHSGQTSLRDLVALLAARGIDARGVLLTGSVLSDESIRHGGAYLVELVATAQRGDPFNVNRERSHAR